MGAGGREGASSHVVVTPHPLRGWPSLTPPGKQAPPPTALSTCFGSFVAPLGASVTFFTCLPRLPSDSKCASRAAAQTGPGTRCLIDKEEQGWGGGRRRRKGRMRQRSRREKEGSRRRFLPPSWHQPRALHRGPLPWGRPVPHRGPGPASPRALCAPDSGVPHLHPKTLQNR